MSTTVVIAQPTYFAWAGALDAFDQADVVVLLDTVQFSRQSWQQRNRILTAQGVHWLTVPVRHPTRVPIRDVRVDHGQPWARDHLRTIRSAYRRAPGWWHWGEALEQYYEDAAQPGELWRVNRDSLLLMAPHLHLRLVLASELAATGSRESLVLNLCREVGADTYLAAPGSAAYLAEHNPFPGSGVTLVYHQYEPEPYPQVHGGGGFVPRLSALDLLLNVDGIADVAGWRVIRAGRRPWRTAEDVHAEWRRAHQGEEVITNGA